MPRAVLVVTHSTDHEAMLVRAELESMGVDVVWFDTDEPASHTFATFALTSGQPDIRLHACGRECRGVDVGAVFYRFVRQPSARHIRDRSTRQLAEAELRAALEGTLLALEPSIWINHPLATQLAKSKLLQLRAAASVGLDVPDTAVTSDLAEVRELYRRWNGRMTARLAGGQIAADTAHTQFAIHTTHITEDDLADDGPLAHCPAIYQQLVDRTHDVRVTVVGDEVFGCRIRQTDEQPQTEDWRAAPGAGRAIDACRIDEAMADRCRALTRALHLHVAGIDFACRPDGRSVFLEVSATCRWDWAQQATGHLIGEAVARRLAAACRGC